MKRNNNVTWFSKKVDGFLSDTDSDSTENIRSGLSIHKLQSDSLINDDSLITKSHPSVL
jgi:hypothetical protein